MALHSHTCFMFCLEPVKIKNLNLNLNLINYAFTFLKQMHLQISEMFSRNKCSIISWGARSVHESHFSTVTLHFPCVFVMDVFHFGFMSLQ
jgi:hypothetical protein